MNDDLKEQVRLRPAREVFRQLEWTAFSRSRISSGFNQTILVAQCIVEELRLDRT